MIYFAQDQGTYHIKIGFTDKPDAEARLKNLDTGNPLGLVLLATISGTREDESALHQRFHAAHLRGEWFCPTPELLLYILESQKPKLLPKVPVPSRYYKKWLLPPGPLSIYLAGKIEKNGWRHALVNGLIGTGVNPADENLCPETGGGELPRSWPVLQCAIFKEHDYVGPFFANCDHGCAHGEDQHGLAASGQWDIGHGEMHSRRDEVARLCFSSIHKADLVFAWIDSPDCYGTVAELGYAAALGKVIWIAGPRRFRDMWFLYETASRLGFGGGFPDRFLDQFLTEARPVEG